MLDPKVTYDTFRARGIAFFAGVPDSALKDFCAVVTDRTDRRSHIITANEGGAIGLAAGYFLATGELPLVYMQNSGQGNSVNPLVSLVDREVYSIPLLLLIGWRGEPGKHDEPQHIKQGRITLSLLETLGIPYEVLPQEPAAATSAITRAVATAHESSAPFAIVVRKGTFESYELEDKASDAQYSPYGCSHHSMTREEAVTVLVDHLEPETVIVSTTGKASRELAEYRARLGQEPGRDFLTVGSMGHASQIALGIALAKPDRRVCCLDGDGAVIMHMGSLAIIGSGRPGNFLHFVINNGAHDSVGGQPTAGLDIDIPAIAQACGYRHSARAESRSRLVSAIEEAKASPGPALVEIRTRRGARPELGRPENTPLQNKQVFMRLVRS